MQWQQNLSTIKFAISKFYCGGISHEKQHFGGSSSLPQGPPPLKNGNFYFYCRLAVSERPILMQCWYWDDMKCVHPWVQIFYLVLVLGLGSGGIVLGHFQTPTLYWNPCETRHIIKREKSELKAVLSLSQGGPTFIQYRRKGSLRQGSFCLRNLYREQFLHEVFEHPQGSGTSRQNSWNIPDSSLRNPRKTNFRVRARSFRPPPLRMEDPDPTRRSPDPKS